jgi:hypothetical protein
LARAYFEDGQTHEAVTLLKHVVAVGSQTYAKSDPLRSVCKDLLTNAFELLRLETEAYCSDGSEQDISTV